MSRRPPLEDTPQLASISAAAAAAVPTACCGSLCRTMMVEGVFYELRTVLKIDCIIP